ncbi:hypothetical protein [Cypionkella sp.]|uniref:hypothetical protein n=1 Tax=Cypionkella sp. TaxID=2811411 RepID=UPI002AB815BC|nr:hypothetical protein [Cypionkella sp.]MDZ4394121.1 hypothetical protein [Cypionkella sp.]
MKGIWAGVALAVVLGLFYLTWQAGRDTRSGYLYNMPDARAEAGYCLAVVVRVREITRGQGEARLEAFVDQQMAFWGGRVAGQTTQGRVALARDATAPGVNEGAHLHLAIQECGLRAVRFYGQSFAAME